MALIYELEDVCLALQISAIDLLTDVKERAALNDE